MKSFEWFESLLTVLLFRAFCCCFFFIWFDLYHNSILQLGNTHADQGAGHEKVTPTIFLCLPGIPLGRRNYKGVKALASLPHLFLTWSRKQTQTPWNLKESWRGLWLSQLAEKFSIPHTTETLPSQLSICLADTIFTSGKGQERRQ